jgi:hypothetical protein
MEIRSPFFDAAPFGRPLDDGSGLIWEDLREIHKVIVHFKSRPPEDLKLQYWKTEWPQRRPPKDRIPEGGDIGWMGLGDWFTGRWQTADADLSIERDSATLTFRPVNEREFPGLKDFPATFRTTLKIRLISESEIPDVRSIEAYTDSVWDKSTLTVLWRSQPKSEPSFEAFNGYVESVQRLSPERYILTVWRTKNPNPNSFDKTLLTIKSDAVLTVSVEDLSVGPIYVADYGICMVEGEEERDFTGVCSEILIDSKRGVYDAVADLPEQTWSRAWRNMVPKRGRLYLPLATDGGRHKFRLNPDGSVVYRTNNRYLINCPGRDTPKLQSDRAQIRVSFDLPYEPVKRKLQDGTLPIGITLWKMNGTLIRQMAFVTLLDGMDPKGPPPPGDAFGIFMAEFSFENPSDEKVEVRFPIRFSAENEDESVRLEGDGLIWAGDKLRGCVELGGDGELREEKGHILFAADLEPRARCSIVIKLPYVSLEGDEIERLKALDFNLEREAVVGYWRRRLGEGMTLLTPEGMLNEFYRAHAGHLLINCERKPNSDVRFARVGSFGYGVYGNESCMMIVDLDRRGYHREARECLEAFLRYQGTVALPGNFSSHEGVLYGAHRYECGGYNQHHGWILWCLVEHYKFTRDDEWLRRIAPNLRAASDWVIRERGRTLEGEDIGRGLLPHGSLEDIRDWWQWLSTNVYTWRGLDAAAWGLEQVGHPESERIRREADDYRTSIVRAFTEAVRRSPVVRLRDNTCVPHFPSHVHRRGRSFGWIRETLEGAIHLLITRIIDPDSKEALWILRDYEDNLYLSDHYGYKIEDFDRNWFDWGGFSMQACLLLGAEPYLYRDDVKHALRAIFNAMAANYFPDIRMLTEHALPRLGDWRGDHYKSSDEANAAGWLRYIFVREEGDELLLGQAVPREWMSPGNRVGVENAHTYFGRMSLIYEADEDGITATIQGPRRNPPARIKLRFRPPEGKRVISFRVNGEKWFHCDERWVYLPGDIGEATVRAVWE